MTGDVLENQAGGGEAFHGDVATRSGTGRILVPVDFSPCSLAALEHAASMAESFGYSIDVLHVRALPHALDPDDALASGGQRETLAQFVETEAGKAMQGVLQHLESRGIAQPRGRLGRGKPSDTIVQIADDEGYDLIVMGTYGTAGIGHLLHGSVAEKVVRRAPCPVLTIRTDPEMAGRAPGSGDGRS